MGQVTESIFSGKRIVIPMAEVSHIENYKSKAIRIIFKHSSSSNEGGGLEPVAYLIEDEAEGFLKAWCQYRHELEKETLIPEPV